MEHTVKVIKNFKEQISYLNDTINGGAKTTQLTEIKLELDDIDMRQ